MSNSGSDSKFRQFLKNRGICNLIIILANLIVFVWFSIEGSTTDSLFMATHGAMYTPFVVSLGQWWTLFSSMFLHFGLEHITGNMLLLFFIGDNLERAVGSFKYLIIYIVGGLAGNFLSLGLAVARDENILSAGASGAIFAVIGALLYIVIRNHGRLEDLTAGRILLMTVYILYEGFRDSGVNNAAHVGGLIGGFLLAVLLYHKRRVHVQS